MDNMTKTAAELRAELAKKDAQSASAAAKDKAYSARQTILSVLDEGTFVEVGAYVKRTAGERDYAGVICGYGAIDSRLVFIFAQDYYRMKGAMDEVQAKKICDLYALAVKSGAPMIGVFNSAGAVLDEGADALAAYGKVMQAVASASGIIPQIAYINGVCAGSAAVLASMFDILIASDRASIYVSPISTLKAHSAGAATDSFASGLLTKLYPTDAEALGELRALVNYLPQNNKEGTVTELCADDLNRAVDLSLADSGYDMKTVLGAIGDNGNFFTLSDGYAPEVITALISIGGTVCGTVANQPSENGGRLTPNAAKKIAKFVSMCDAFAIPVLTLVDSEGIIADDGFESAPYAAELAKLAYAYTSAETAKITVVLGKAFGNAFILLGSKSVGADLALALDTAKISVLSPKAAVAFLENEKVAKKSREQLEAEWAAENASPVKAAVHGEIDDVIATAELRMRICAALSMLASKCGHMPNRRHAVLPL